MSETFSGHELETGLLQRVRRWRDALPVLVLPAALRVAGSPSYVALSLVAVLLTRSLVSVAGSAEAGLAGALARGVADDAILSHPLGPLTAALVLWTDFRWLAVLAWVDALRLLALTLLWAVPAATIARAGACYAAGRDQSFLQNAAVAARRLPAMVAIALVPLACIVVLSLTMMLVGLLTRGGAIGVWFGEFAAVLAVPLMILAGLILAGGFAAGPLAWAATVIEKRADALDSLSRGYEYLYRRPVQLLLYGLCSYLLVTIVFLLALAVSSAALVAGTLSAEIGSGGRAVPLGFQVLVSHLPLAVAATAFWGLVGAVYLLMRQSANQQELEDIAISPVDRREPELPTLTRAG